MGIQTMGSSGRVGYGERHSCFLPLPRQSSFCSLTLAEVQNQLGGSSGRKPLSSMNLDELLKNVWTAEMNRILGTEHENASPADKLASASALDLTPSLTSTFFSNKTVDEVWKHIQQLQNNNDQEKKIAQPQENRQPTTLGEMTLEDFLVKAGVVTEDSLDKQNAAPVSGDDDLIINTTTPQNLPKEIEWLQQYQHPLVPQPAQQQLTAEQNTMGSVMPGHPVPEQLAIVPSSNLEVSYPESENLMAMSSPLIATFSDTAQTPRRKRVASGEIIEKTVERKHKRMIKNRESAARSRARKQAYTNELENKVSRLEEENERLKKHKELQKMLPCAPLPPEPKYQLRRTSSASF